MPRTPARRLTDLPVYAFAEVDRKVQGLRDKGIEPIDFGVGDPTAPTPEVIRAALKAGCDTHATSGYPSYIGGARLREAVAAWMQRRFGVELDSAHEICSTIGSKEGIFNFPEAFVDPGDTVLCPSPGYPPYSRGTLFAEGSPYFYPVPESQGFQPDFSDIPETVLSRCKILWINYPHSPSGRVASLDELRRIVEFARKHDIIVASDEAYSELWFCEEPPHSILEVAREGVVVFQSLSKRSAMTGYRIGFCAGDPAIIDAFKKLKTNIDSGTPNFVQEAAAAALGDEAHVTEMRRGYLERRDILLDGLSRAGLDVRAPEGTIYIWQRAPAGMSSLDLANELLHDDVAVVCTPGSWIAEPLADGTNPGEGYVRFALVPSLEDTRKAADRIASLALSR